MTSMQSDPVVFNYVKTEHSPAPLQGRTFPKEEPFQILFFDWAFYLPGALGVFDLFKFSGYVLFRCESTANGSLTVLSDLVKLVIYVRISFKGYISHS